MQTVDEALDKLQRSKFRASFHLTKKEKEYVRENGAKMLKKHAIEFISKRLASACPENDGRQTPMCGHPVFKAQHACACCCRKCLEKWYRVPQGRLLTPDEQERIVRLLMAWIERQMKD